MSYHGLEVESIDRPNAINCFIAELDEGEKSAKKKNGFQ